MHFNKQFSREYMDFESKHLRELIELHTYTKDEELRVQIIEIRKTLGRLYKGRVYD